MSLRGQYRHITLRHERHMINNTAPALAPGQAKFFSYFLPSLPAGEYKIQIDQTVTTDSAKPGVSATPANRTFEVLAPEWAISAASSDTTNNNDDDDSAVVLSTFPASGETAPSFRTLPHLVLKDPQLPWIRPVSKKDYNDGNSIPWFALIVFSADELQLREDVGQAYFSKVNATVNDTLGWDLPASSIDKIDHARVANFIPKPSVPDQRAGTQTSVIPVSSDVVRQLFTSAQKPGEFDVAPFRFMSHVRTVSTAGTMSAARAENDGDPTQSGTQTVAITVPTPVMAHLVSLQGIDTQSVDLVANRDHVLMTSLFSWTYTALPPGSPDVVSMLQHLGKKDAGLSVLRTDLTVDPLGEKSFDKLSEPDIAKLITKRQIDGYTLTRYRTITGEQTAAIYRGPLTPTRVPYPLHKKVSFQSNFGTDLQILDPDVGLMDLSYASAWQLGKTMAMGDPAFTAALSRLRIEVHQAALESARKDIFKRLRASGTQGADENGREVKQSVFSDTNPRVSYMPRQEIKADVVKIVQALNGINGTVEQAGTAFSTNRWRRRDPSLMPSTRTDLESEADLFSLRSDHVYHQMPFHSLFYLKDGTANTPDGGPYNYHSIPNNTDYAVVQEWVLDRLHLAGIPAHYILPDPSHLPPESLRFFHIDGNWLDAMVDGALSLANHLADVPEEDYTRSSLKETLNRYLTTPLVGDYLQQIPAYGFMLRSQLLVQFPDLAVGAEFALEKDDVHTSEDWAHAKPKAPILVQRKLAPDIMLVLLDREPPKLSSVTFTLPAHQQTFIAAFGITSEKADLRFKRIYATGADEALPELDIRERRKNLVIVPDLNPYPTSQVIDWHARTLKIEPYAQLVHQNLQNFMPRKTQDYRHATPTAAVFALQLNEPIYTLVITAQKPVVQGQTPDTDDESLDSWQILHEPKGFQFYPPPFPGDKIKARSQLPVSRMAHTFSPTLISLEPKSKPKSSQAPSAPDEAHRRAEQQTIRLVHGISPKVPDKPVLPMDMPEFEFKIFRLGKPKDEAITTNADRPFDLVFSIIRGKWTDPEAWPLRIMHFDLTIKIAGLDQPRPPDDDFSTPRALLRSDVPDGPAPTMLSNLRYNVLVRKWDVQEGQLQLSIVPRTKWGVHMRDTVEASFIFPMARIFPWEVPKDATYPGQVKLRSYMLPQSETDPNKKPTEYKHDDVGKFQLTREGLL
ncbi:hypothetical protein CLCR_09478 [Cladophialophora carrionii]|uniref:Uncharacterized protein n=1 Tax=Cladophialophora carrionii TaxID=86049 RepID=A0A1C1CWH4_9EURO|nr:hypothetical protein CLCR_09478 [Cladophialophora carrionii]